MLQDLFAQNNISSVILSAFSCSNIAQPITQNKITTAFEQHKIILFVGGTGNPFFTTDTNAVLRALQIGADEVWKATKVDGIYDADPHLTKDAKLLPVVSYQEILDRGIAVMDRTAITLAQKHALPIRVFNMLEPDAFHKALENPEFGREYKISKVNSSVLISYKHEKTRLYVVIKSEDSDYKKIGEWIKRAYEKDRDRHVDFVKYVYRALSMKGKRFVFAFSRSKNQALKEADYVSRNLDRLKEHQKIYVSKINTKLAKIPELRLAKKGAVNSLNKLTLNLGNKRGIFAGYPWFFQFWSRDELISLKGLLANKQDREVKKILLKNLNSMKNGKIPNITMPKGKHSNADSIGWLFKSTQRTYNKSELLIFITPKILHDGAHLEI